MKFASIIGGLVGVLVSWSSLAGTQETNPFVLWCYLFGVGLPVTVLVCWVLSRIDTFEAERLLKRDPFVAQYDRYLAGEISYTELHRLAQEK